MRTKLPRDRGADRRTTTVAIALGVAAGLGACRPATDAERAPVHSSDVTPSPAPRSPEVASSDADSRVRHPAQVRVPLRIAVERATDGALVRWPADAVESVEIAVGEGMTVGAEVKLALTTSEAPPAEYGSISLSTDFFTADESTRLSPAPGPADARWFVHAHVTIFETDVPAQHHWAPRSGRHRMLVERRLVAAVP